MRRHAVGIACAALLLAATSARASSLLLKDGQVIKGTEIKRQGDAYLVTMVGGNTVAFPVALVKGITLDDDGSAKAPPGFDFSGPKTLAGPTKHASQDPKDQLKVLGPPSRWPQNAVDTTWVPTSAFDLEKDVLAGSRSTWSKSAVDTTWVPTWGFDPYKDALAGSRATWAKNVIDTTWTPTDSFGFKPLWPPKGSRAPEPAPIPTEELPPRSSRVSADAEAPEEAAKPSPWKCAEKLFATDAASPTAMKVEPLKIALYEPFGLPLYEATGVLNGSSRKGVFTIAGGECRLVGGDAEALNGLNLSAEHAMMQDGASLNTALVANGGSRITPASDKVAYALAFLSITDPFVSGTAGATLKVIEKPEELRSIASKTVDSCELSKGRRRKEERAAVNAYAAPRITAGAEGDVVTFLTWCSAGGKVTRNTVVIARGGVVSAKRDPVASHVGLHSE